MVGAGTVVDGTTGGAVSIDPGWHPPDGSGPVVTVVVVVGAVKGACRTAVPPADERLEECASAWTPPQPATTTATTTPTGIEHHDAGNRRTSLPRLRRRFGSQESVPARHCRAAGVGAGQAARGGTRHTVRTCPTTKTAFSRSTRS